VSVYERSRRTSPSSNGGFLAQCEDVGECIRSAEFSRGVERLIVAAGNAVRRDQLGSLFEDLDVEGVGELKTTLVWFDEDIPVEGSVGLSDLLFDRDRGALVASQDAEDVLVDLIADVLVRELQLDGHSLGEMSAKLVAMLRVPPERIDRHLTKLHVPVLPEEAELDFVEEDDGGLIDSSAVDEDETGVSADEVHEHQEDRDVLDEQEDEVDTQDIDAAKATVPTGKEPSQNDTSSTEADDRTGEKRDADTPSTSDDAVSLGGRRRRRKAGRPKEHDGTEPGRSRSGARGKKGWIAVTRVKPQQDEGADEPPERQQRRRRVDQAAVKRVIGYERERGRLANEMDHGNEGYDIESMGPDGEIERYIEVKGLSGAWTEFGVSVSRAQHRKAIREGQGFWLYVVEFALEPDRSRVFAIQDPAELIDQYWFDDGWKLLSREKDGPGTGARPRKGASVVVDGTKPGRIKGIRSHGALQHLQIEFDNGQIESVVYSPRRVSVVDDVEAE
jgi:hypothetical protein